MTKVADLAAEVSVDGIEGAQRGLRDFGREVDDTAKRQEGAARKSEDHDKALRTVGTGALVAGGALVTGFGLATGATISFDKEMSGVQAVAGATSQELGLLRDAAIEAGAATSFSASQAAEAESELARAGVGVADILGGALTGSLDLAAAGNLELATSATIAAQAMNIFNLEGRDVTHIADVLAAGANKSAAEVFDLGQGLSNVGAMAKLSNLGLEETVGVISLFSDNALVGAEAGTSMKSMLLALQAPSGEAADLMEELGLQVYDAQGQFIGLEALAGLLQDRLGNLTIEQRNAALATIAGSYGIRAAGILYDAGAEGVRAYTDAVDDQGAASRMAGIQLDNLSGDLEELRGSVETALIQGGSKATGALRGMTQSATALVNSFADAPSWMQTATVGIAGIGGAALTSAGALAFMIPKIKDVRTSFMTLGTGTQLGLGLVTTALTIGGIALANWARKKEEARIATEAFTDALLADAGALGEQSRAVIANRLEQEGVTDALIALKGHMASGRGVLDVFTEAVFGDTEALEEMRRAMLMSGEATIAMAEGHGASENALRQLEHVYLTSNRTWEESIRLVFGNVDANDFLIDSDHELLGVMEDLTAERERSQSILEGTSDRERTAADVTRELSAAKTELGDLVAAGIDTGERYHAAQARVLDLTREQASIDGALKAAQEGVNTAMEDGAQSAEELEKALADLEAQIFGTRDASRDYEDALADVRLGLFGYRDELARALEDGKVTEEENLNLEKSYRDIERSAEDAGLKAVEVFEAMAGRAATTEEATEILRGEYFKLMTELAPGSPLRAHLAGLISDLDRAAQPRTARVLLDTSQAREEMARFRDDMANSSTTIRPRAVSGGPARPSAAGGPRAMGELLLVGEQGPELFVPDSDGFVVPADLTAAALSHAPTVRGADALNIEIVLKQRADGTFEVASAMHKPGTRSVDRAVRVRARSA